MSLALFLESLCHSLGTVQIVEIFTLRTTTQNLSKKFQPKTNQLIILLNHTVRKINPVHEALFHLSFRQSLQNG
jgi:hypothetical protein